MDKRRLAFLLPCASSNYEQCQKNRMLYVMNLAVFLGSLFTGIANLANGWNREATALLLLTAICLIGFILSQSGYFIPAAIILCTVLFIVIDTVLFYGAGLFDSGLIAYPLFILCVTFLFGKKRGLILATAACVASVVGLYLAEQMGIFDPTFPATLLRVIVIALLLVVAALIIWGVRESWEANLLHMKESYDLTLEGWARALEYRDGGTGGHTRRVAELCTTLARRLGCNPQEVMAIHRGALLHDIGKMAIPDHLLLKTGSLTPEEWVIMKKHTVLGGEFVVNIPFLQEAIDVPRCHHEHWDGSGYPDGLRGKQIPLSARIFTVVDNWDALNSDRPYRKAWQRKAVIEYLLKNAGKLFDPQVVEEFLLYITEGKTGLIAEPHEQQDAVNRAEKDPRQIGNLFLL